MKSSHVITNTILILIVISAAVEANQLQHQRRRSLAKGQSVQDQSNNNSRTTTTTTTPEPDPTVTPLPQLSCGLPLYRLPKTIEPHHYDLLLMPEIESESFEGAVQISISINATKRHINDKTALIGANQIVLHANENLNIDNVWFIDQTNKLPPLALTSPTPNLKLNKQVDATLNQLLLEKKPPKQQQNTTSQLISSNEDEYVKVLKVCREPKHQLVVITLERDLKPISRGLLHLTFTGYLQKKPDLLGLYLSPWYALAAAGKNESGFNVLTQLQPTHARKMFPCFDEPSLKATFELNLIYPANKVALANTVPVFESSLLLPTNTSNAAAAAAGGDGKRFEQSEQEYKLVRFARTPPMSTYLLAITVGDYEFIGAHVQLKTKKVRIRVYTAPSKTHLAQFALQTTVKAMKVLHRLFDNDEYPLDKLDLVGVRDFSQAAMENWGLITFKEEYLLVDPENTSPQLRAQVASTILHELAHQWFGNLVTMSWWNDVWLNEGFATWFESKILAEVYPEYDHLYLFDSHVKALESDHMRDVRPIRQQYAVLLESNINEMFDYAGYHKPASLIRMLENSWRKWTNFWPLMKSYIETNRYKSVNVRHLIEALRVDKNLPAPMIDTMRSWLDQPGLPLISLSLNGSQLQWEQQRLIKHTGELTDAERAQVWSIPVRASLFDGKKIHTEYYLLNQTRGSIDLPQWWSSQSSTTTTTTTTTTKSAPANPKQWIKFNKDFDGLYLVRYSDEMFRSFIGSSADLMRLSSYDRINLIEEQMILLGSRRSGVDRLLTLMVELSKHEKHGAVLYSLMRAFDTLSSLFNRHNSTLAQIGHRILGDKIFKSFPKEILPSSSSSSPLSYWDWIGRTNVFERLVHLDYKPAIARALQLYDESTNRTALGVQMREPIYAAVARRGSKEQFARLRTLYDKSDSLEHKLILLDAMFRSNNRTRLQSGWTLLMESVVDDKLVEQLDETRLSPLVTMTRDRIGRQYLLELLATKYADLVDLNEDESLAPLLEELYLNAAPDELAELNKVVMKLEGDQVSDWPASLEWILQIIEWRTNIRNDLERELELAWRTISANL